MQKTFIQQVLDHFLENHPDHAEDICVVFPTRRAGLFFKKEFASRINKPVFSPSVTGIQDFIVSLTSYQIPDKLTLIFELFQVYKKYFPDEGFDRFYQWGQMLLKDYDEIDRYLVNAPKLFSNIQDLHDIDHAFSHEDTYDHISEFWSNFSGKELSRVKKEFIRTWEQLGKIYTDYQQHLESKNLIYEGLAYRRLSEQNIAELLENSFIKKFRKIIFAGFYAFSIAEEELVFKLVQSEKAEILTDADIYYADDKKQEAGNFLRKGKLLKNDFSWKGDYFNTGRKKLDIIGVPLQIGQTKVLGGELKKLFTSSEIKPEETCIVVPDENLLFPVLYSLPEEVSTFNVTMGYPLHYTPLFPLFESLIRLQKNKKFKEGNPIRFYHRDVLKILTHPYIYQLAPYKIDSLIRKYEMYKWIYFVFDDSSDDFFRKLFQPINTLAEAFDYFNETLNTLLGAFNADDEKYKLEKEYIFYFYSQLNRLKEIVKQYEVDLSLQNLWNLLKEIIYSSKIPFTGEPLSGLQIMGFLETRVLDFKNLFVLSVNEDILPAGIKSHSFIPYSLRKGYGLPTFEEHDAVYSYHFYRLLQRAENVQLYYNTEVKNFNSGEKSRYILQIEHEMKKKAPNVEITERIITTDIVQRELPELSVPYSENVNDLIHPYINGTKSLSASALNMYITCNLKFYFRYLAGIKEREEVSDDIEANTFGSLFHKSMENLYGSTEEFNVSLNTTFSDEQIAGCVEKAFIEVLPGMKEIEGKNLLLKKVITELVSRTVKKDVQLGPFSVKGLEKELNYEISDGYGNKFALKGVIDRIDELEDGVRIVDYKTGEVKLSGAALEDIISDTRHKVEIQAYLYAWLYAKNNPGAEKVAVGIYPLKKINQGMQLLKRGDYISKEELNQFEAVLRKLLNKIFNEKAGFSPTSERKNCEYCGYKNICNR